MNSSELKGFLTGLMFGDGYIDKGITKRSFRIKTIYQDFAEQIKKNFDDCNVFTTSVKFHKGYIKDNVNHKDSYEVFVKAHPYFVKKYHHFYDDYKNRIASKESLNWLTPMGLAYWYMSDGYICLVGKTKGFIRDRRVDICTDRYNLETINFLIDMLYNNFNIKCSLIKRDKFYRIRIKRESYLTFYNLIFPYVDNIPSMRYKLYFGFNNKPNWMTEEMWKYQNKLRSATALTNNVEGKDIV